MTREDELFFSIAPFLVTFNEWKQHPENFLPGTDMDKQLDEFRRSRKVTVEEWDVLMKRFEENA